jgi:hypothetical protein
MAILATATKEVDLPDETEQTTTLEALRKEFDELQQQLKGLTGAGLGRVTDTIREHSVPLGLVGLGIAVVVWFLFNGPDAASVRQARPHLANASRWNHDRRP